MAQLNSSSSSSSSNGGGGGAQMVPTQTGMSFSYTPNGYTINQPQQLMQNVSGQPSSYDIYRHNQQMYMMQQQQHQQQQHQHQHQQHQHQHQQQQQLQQQQLQYKQYTNNIMMREQSIQHQQQQQQNIHQHIHPQQQQYQQTPALYHSPNSSPLTVQNETSPEQSPKSEPGTPDKRPKLRVTIPTTTSASPTPIEKQDTSNMNNYPYSSLPPPSALPSQYVQNLPSPSTFYPEFYQPNFMMSPIHSNGPNSANPFMIPTSPFRESGIRTSETK
ncbi:hypothetical protein EDC94DRAFT_424882 [Helicostylum pulchrum]|nr:hypothetical protein EDC94DRAFT_424882 [Helicostylum pulchrum]